MDKNLVGPILESLWLAKKATELMPELPTGMKPSHIRVLEVIYKNYNDNGTVCISDVSAAIKITKPNITKLINELVGLGAVKKSISPDDKRVIFLELSFFGKSCVEKYVLEYHAELAKAFSKLDTAAYLSMIEHIKYIYRSMRDVAKKNI